MPITLAFALHFNFGISFVIFESLCSKKAKTWRLRRTSE